MTATWQHATVGLDVLFARRENGETHRGSIGPGSNLSDPAFADLPQNILDAAQAVRDDAAKMAQYEAMKQPAPSVADLTDRIKSHAGNLILAQYSFSAQLNMTMRASELVDIKASGGALAADELAEEAALKAAAAWIKSVRAASNTLEAALPSLTEAQRAAYDVAQEFTEALAQQEAG